MAAKTSEGARHVAAIEAEQKAAARFIRALD